MVERLAASLASTGSDKGQGPRGQNGPMENHCRFRLRWVCTLALDHTPHLQKPGSLALTSDWCLRPPPRRAESTGWPNHWSWEFSQ